MKDRNIKFPKNFFNIKREVISSKEALKDVVPVNWTEALKNRKNNDKQIIKLKNFKEYDKPFEWSKNVLNGKSIVKIVSNKN